MKNENDLKKVEDDIFKFENVGDSIIGVLLSREKGTVYGNEVYKLKLIDGKVATVFSTIVLESKMASVKIGDTVKIEFTGTKPNPKAGQEDTKLFDLYI